MYFSLSFFLFGLYVASRDVNDNRCFGLWLLSRICRPGEGCASRFTLYIQWNKREDNVGVRSGFAWLRDHSYANFRDFAQISFIIFVLMILMVMFILLSLYEVEYHNCTQTNTYTHALTCIHTLTYTHIHAHAYTYTHTYRQTQTHIHTLAYTHIHSIFKNICQKSTGWSP